MRAVGLPKLNDAGAEIAYTLREDNSPGYTADKTEASSGETITNRHVPEPTRIEIRKLWDDDGDRDALRPTSVTVHLFADGTEIQNVQITPDENGDWYYAFENLPKFAGGKEIRYSVTEDPVENYETNIDGFTITNKHEPEKTRIEVSKLWDDENDNDGLRPKSVTVNLLANGAVVQTVQIKPDENGRWYYAFEDLPKLDGGKEIQYSVTEDPVSGYETTVEGYTITNKHTPETIRINVTKNWSDSNNKAGKRPASITIHLLADGKEIETVQITPDSKGNWSYAFEDLPKYEKGKAITYTVTEDSIKGYYTSITPSKDGFLIRNSTSPITGDGAQPLLWAALLAGSAFALLCTSLLLRRKNAGR